MKKISNLGKLSLMLSLIITPHIAVSSENAVNESKHAPEYADVVKSLEDKFEYVGIVDFISKTPDESGYFIVMADGNNIYYDGVSDKIVMGDIYDISTKTNLSEKLKGKYNNNILKSFSDDEKILYPSSVENADWVTIYTDPTCGYCRKIQENIKGYNELGISIAYIPFPRGEEGSRPYEELIQVWCSDDRKASLDLAKNDKAHQIRFKNTESCKSIVDKGLKTGESLRVAGTPSIFTESGYNIPGFIEPDVLREIIDNNK